MCLITKSSASLIAENNITVYKIVELCSSIVDTSRTRKHWILKSVTDLYICSPYRYYNVKKRDSISASLEFNKHAADDDYFYVSKGFHAYTNLDKAIDEANFWNCFIVRCIIPKGSKYYIGEFNYYESIASDTLKYLELLTK